MFISFTYHSPYWRSRARIVGGQVWGPSVLLPSRFASSTHSCHLMIQMAAPAPASMSAFQPERRGKSDGAGHAPHLSGHNLETGHHFWSHMIGQNIVTWPRWQQRSLGNVVFILDGHVFRKEDGNISYEGELALSVQRPQGSVRWGSRSKCSLWEKYNRIWWLNEWGGWEKGK